MSNGFIPRLSIIGHGTRRCGENSDHSTDESCPETVKSNLKMLAPNGPLSSLSRELFDETADPPSQKYGLSMTACQAAGLLDNSHDWYEKQLELTSSETAQK